MHGECSKNCGARGNDTLVQIAPLQSDKLGLTIVDRLLLLHTVGDTKRSSQFRF